MCGMPEADIANRWDRDAPIKDSDSRLVLGCLYDGDAHAGHECQATAALSRDVEL